MKHKLLIISAVTLLVMACGGGGGGSAPVASSYIAGVTVDDSTTPTKLYISDFGLSVVKSVDITSGISTIIAGKSGVSGALNNVTGTSATFFGVEGLALSGTNLYTVDALNCGVRNISTTAPYAVTTLAGNLGVNCSNTDNAVGASATFNLPRNATVDRITGDLYVTDSVNNSIRKITPAGVVTTIVSGFNNPFGIVSDNASPPILYVTDQGNNSIKKVAYSGGAWGVTLFAGSSTNAAGLPTNANGTSATFNAPQGITIDSTFTNLYVVDALNNAVRKIVIAAPQAVSLIAGSGAGTPGSANNSTGTSATFNSPMSITYGGGNLYITDQNGTTLRVIGVTGTNAVTNLTIN